MTRRIALVLALAALLAVVPPVAANGAEVTEYQLQLTPVSESGAAQLIVTVVLDPTASLPATVSVPVPDGATLLWSGELLGGDPNADPYREATSAQVGGVTVYTFTLEESPIGQVELMLGPPEVSGSSVRSSVTWVNPGAEVLVSGSVVAEAGARDVEITPAAAGESRTNEAGETLYPVGGLRVPTGASYAIDVSWRRGGGEFPVLTALGAALALALVALVLVLARERSRARRAAAAARRAEDRGWE